MMKKPKHYFCNTFRQEYLFFIGWSRKEFDNYLLKKLGAKPDLGICYGACMNYEYDEGNLIIIWTFDKKRVDITTHECVHAANYTLDLIGHHPSQKNDEVQAYLTQELFIAATR